MSKSINSFIGLYDVKLHHGSYLPPFLAVDDTEALNAVINTAMSIPSFQRAFVRCIGSYDCATGELHFFEPRILQMGKEKSDEVQN